MFGRREPDQPAATPSQPQKSDLDLDMLNDLSEVEASQPDEPVPEMQPEPEPDASWHAATPSILGPSVTRLLQAAEAAHQNSPSEPAKSAPVTEQLSPIEQATNEVPAASTPPPVVQPAAPSLPTTPGAQNTRTRTIAESVIGPDDFFDGRYRSERGVRIQGNARGSIESRQYIYVEAGAQVEADLSAEDITVSGDFSGQITCRRRLEVTSSGKIRGQVQTSMLVVQEGGAIDGQLSMRGEGSPAESNQG